MEQVAEQLDALRFYLRTSADSDASTLYRLFHQGLADQLRGTRAATPIDMAWRVFDGLLAAVPGSP